MKWVYGFILTVTVVCIGGVLLRSYGNKSSDSIQQITDSYSSTTMEQFSLTSTAFPANGEIPEKYTCEGENINPPLAIQNVPEGAKSLVLLLDDPDIPDSIKQSRNIEKFDHWIVFNIPTSTTLIAENTKPPGIQGKNGVGTNGYTGPCPPDREHRYFFKLYALNSMLDLKESATADQVMAAMNSTSSILGETELIGRYNKKENR
jgi:Raf kinase inhibitor-like YbhB/YbcL family protein